MAVLEKLLIDTIVALKLALKNHYEMDVSVHQLPAKIVNLLPGSAANTATPLSLTFSANAKANEMAAVLVRP